MDKEGDTDIHMKEDESTVRLQHTEKTFPFTDQKLPFISQRSKVVIHGAASNYHWKGQEKLEATGIKHDTVAVFKPAEDTHSLKVGSLRIHAGMSINLPTIVITALVVQTRVEQQ